MKKANLILIAIVAFSLIPIFFVNTAVAATGSVYIYPDSDNNIVA